MLLFTNKLYSMLDGDQSDQIWNINRAAQIDSTFG